MEDFQGNHGTVKFWGKISSFIYNSRHIPSPSHVLVFGLTKAKSAVIHLI